MPSYEHSKIIQEISSFNKVPLSETDYAAWVQAENQLNFLRKNSKHTELVVYACSQYTFIHSIVVPNQLLQPLNQDDFLRWGGDPFIGIASYVSGGGRNDIWIERSDVCSGSKILNEGKMLVFGRTFEGWKGDGGTYFELNQEYSHLTDIHWRPEESSYCRFDGNGDLEHAVSVSVNSRSDEKGVTLISFKWPLLDEYLAISDSSLVRLFDFTLFKEGNFNGWSNSPEEVQTESQEFFFRRKIDANAGYVRGVQIIHPQRSAVEIASDKWSDGGEKQYMEFIAHDWRNQEITKISTDPKATTNYSTAKDNTLPFELSPAFFRPEVLSKYKADREKYTIGDRDISCRGTWYLRGYDVNEAGQIHVYICDLRNLPYSEQQYWVSYNEEPKAGISKRAVINDFEGQFYESNNSRNKILSIVHRWKEKGVVWWTLRA